MSNNQLTVNTQNIDYNLNINDIKQYLCPQATDKELFQFAQLCKSQNLNPWIREAYLIKYSNAPATMVVGKDVFTKRAQASDKFAGFQAGIIGEKDGELKSFIGSLLPKTYELVGGWAKVFIKGYVEPIEAQVSMAEYGSGQASWKKMPATMIRKVALVQALREAFPEELGGLYDSSEMGAELPIDQKPIDISQAKVESVKHEDIPVIKQVKQTELSDSVNPNAGEVFETYQKPKYSEQHNKAVELAIKTLDAVVVDESFQESERLPEPEPEVITGATHCTFGKDKNKKWLELPMPKLVWYKNMLEAKVCDPQTNPKYLPGTRTQLKGVLSAIMTKEDSLSKQNKKADILKSQDEPPAFTDDDIPF